MTLVYFEFTVTLRFWVFSSTWEGNIWLRSTSLPPFENLKDTNWFTSLVLSINFLNCSEFSSLIDFSLVELGFLLSLHLAAITARLGEMMLREVNNIILFFFINLSLCFISKLGKC
ncbi:Hypothetical protein BC94_0450 [Mycoplasmopsis bovis]|uniref:Uncharacterized protein n=1 Tax=Mycoplasmopsis bovis TaxID=28903 RepID=A0A8D4A581_MYCBV|nr:Hypothetical protein BC85_0451 [Mycoplasmopsis bovis]AMW25737.1 Hypothetical protein BC94_0450 [Mycoplasmopsis bovis]AMW26365.1 Hypothetical protein BC93_0449 [Mycoplasmopsis bovis]